MIARGGSQDAGFTLIEMLVALSVFAIAALALMRLDGYSLSTTAQLDASAMANLVVRNEAALAATDPGSIVRGATETNVMNGGRRFTVRKTISPTGDQRLVRIDLVARDLGSGASSAMTLVKRVG